MDIFTRRSFLKSSAVTSLALGLNATAPDFLKRQLLAGDAEGNKKLLFIFQRGGNDGINTVIPHGDDEYNTTTRPNLYIDSTDSLDLGNNFAGLHPMMAGMMDIYNHSDLTGVDGPGNLAVIHRVGYSGQSQSHFDSQMYWANGSPGEPNLVHGMFNRQVERTLDPVNNRLSAVGLSGSQIDALKGPVALPALRDPSDYRFRGNASTVNKFIGSLPSNPGGGNGKGLLGLYGGPHDFPGKRYRPLVYNTGTALADSMRIVQEAVAQGAYTPENGAVYPDNSFGEKLSTAAMLFKRTPVRILGVNVGGWDTHTNQGQIYGRHGSLLQRVAEGYQALYHDLQDQWEDLVIVSMTEFGRTSKENGSYGTDHANACCMFVGGGSVKGGVYNCDSTTWSDGDIFSRRGRYLERLTDYRQVFAEILAHQFGNTEADTEFVIPTYAEGKENATSNGTSDFDPLDLFV